MKNQRMMSVRDKSMMKDVHVSEVQIIPIKPQGGLVAFASCVINGQFYVGDIAIYTRPDGQSHRLVFPCKTLPNGKRINCFYPIRREASDVLRRAVVGKYEEVTEKVRKIGKRSGSSS